MITAVDTNILLDVFGNDPQFGRASADALRKCLATGRLVACTVVWAETTAAFPITETAENAMRQLGVDFDPAHEPAATSAGISWREYRQAGGPRSRVIADFLIGGYALTAADRLLTRDPRFFRRYFPKLTVVEPGGAW